MTDTMSQWLSSGPTAAVLTTVWTTRHVAVAFRSLCSDSSDRRHKRTMMGRNDPVVVGLPGCDGMDEKLDDEGLYDRNHCSASNDPHCQRTPPKERGKTKRHYRDDPGAVGWSGCSDMDRKGGRTG
ncbi:hypothetical protein V5799_034391 [Amblyomma americanum]|uniref:Uncharacterized protein n=1 Tax=Amblyomma americanum TaxID=6943 RepID=A0AAQ4DKL0_AMBAM